MNRLAYLIPLGLFAFIAGLGGYMLMKSREGTDSVAAMSLDSRAPFNRDQIQSQMIGKPLPEFDLPAATEGVAGVNQADFLDGKPKLLNLWASWCAPCIAEAPQLEALKEAGAPIYGIAMRDAPEDVAAFLTNHGNPYRAIGHDEISAIQFELGSSGLPETFVIDAKGVIRYQHIGDIREEHVPMLLDLLEQAK